MNGRQKRGTRANALHSICDFPALGLIFFGVLSRYG